MKALNRLKHYSGREIRLMEVCGSHTAAIHEAGLESLISPAIHLVSGPGCPVCVTPGGYIDSLIKATRDPAVKVHCFGDMMRVPGVEGTLLDAKRAGGKAEMFYAPLEVLKKACEEPDTLHVVAAVGFETTAPAFGLLARRVKQQGLKNVRFALSLKSMPEALSALCQDPRIDGFLAPGHVSVIIGKDAYLPIQEEYGRPFVVAGFTPKELIIAIDALVELVQKKQSSVLNCYPEVVKDQPHGGALAVLTDVFEKGTGFWRGLGAIEDSAFIFREAYADLDYPVSLKEESVPAGCSCDLVLQGKIFPAECPLFGRTCTPEHPVGACMISREGSCAIHYEYRDQS